MDNTTTQTVVTQSDDALFNSLTQELKKIESEIMPQLEELQSKIPEIYSGYADIVRETVSQTINMLSLKSDTANKIALGAEIAARGLEAFGQWKAAKKHNELLDKFMRVKQEIARNNNVKITRLLPKVKRKLSNSARLFEKYAFTTYNCSSFNEAKTKQISSLNLRALNLYRTSLFLSELCEYLDVEYSSWMSGKQTSGFDIPDYYQVNGMILDKLFDEKPFEALERCADCSGDMNGAEIMLLADYQLSVYALKDTLCTISTEEASPAVRALMESNPGFSHYNQVAEGVINHISKTPDTAITIGWLISTIVIIALCIFYIPGTWWLRTIIGVAGVMAAYRICDKNSFKLKLQHCIQAEEIINETDDIIAAKCGMIKRQEIDYEHKSTTSAFINGFLGA